MIVDLDKAIAEGKMDAKDYYAPGVRVYTANRGIWEGSRRIALEGCEGVNLSDLEKCKDPQQAETLLRVASAESYPSGGWSCRSLREVTLVFHGKEIICPAENNRHVGRVGVHGI